MILVFAPPSFIGISNLKHRNYRNFQFAKRKFESYISSHNAIKDNPMSAFLGFT